MAIIDTIASQISNYDMQVQNVAPNYTCTNILLVYFIEK